MSLRSGANCSSPRKSRGLAGTGQADVVVDGTGGGVRPLGDHVHRQPAGANLAQQLDGRFDEVPAPQGRLFAAGLHRVLAGHRADITCRRVCR